MHKKTMKNVVKGIIATALMAATTLPVLAAPAGSALSLEASLAPLLALGLSALFYLRSGMDA
jgi:hypothetical protein